MIAAAGDNGLRVILPLVNYWDDLGGMRLYLKWLCIAGDVEEFYRAPAARVAYRNWVQSVLTRRNSRTNRYYFEEPAILAWELANEPRCEIPGGRELLLDWVGEMCRFVKTLDSNHLLAVGDEGYLVRAGAPDHLHDGRHGVDTEALLNFGEIDFGGIHFYTESTVQPSEFLESIPPLQSDFFFPRGGSIRTVSPKALRDPGKGRASFTSWDSLGDRFLPLTSLLQASNDVGLFKTSSDFGSLTSAVYDAVEQAEAVLAKTALLNLFYKLSDLKDPIHPERSWFSYIRTLLQIGRARLIALADPALLVSVKEVLKNPSL